MNTTIGTEMVQIESKRTFDQPPAAAQTAPNEGRGDFDARLNRILNAATAVIARVGYEKASMRMVAKEAGVSLAGIYHYFDSKEKMLFLIQFRSFNALLNGLREKLHHVADPVEQLRLMVRSHTNYFVANMAALKVCSHELDSLSGDAYAETLAIRRQYYDLTRGIIDRVFEKYAPNSPADRHVATMCLFGALNWLYRWYDPKRGRSPNVLANQIATQFLQGILGVSPPEEPSPPPPA
ncbi:MAG: TetR/AcrR family transcriptional regulator [Phycisphaerae bacterium]|nr:TetR/AcrR family transcriptional regulator [Phycisphaerae bacterium]NUQ45847.1 TetR/AcrR family transcriptional regulator [Phycisphaerae bacterium]